MVKAMEKTMSATKKSWRVGLAVAVMCLTGVFAQADNGNGNGGNGNHNGWGDGAPAAPEPATIAMIGIGTLMVGGYIIYRLRRRGEKAVPPQA